MRKGKRRSRVSMVMVLVLVVSLCCDMPFGMGMDNVLAAGGIANNGLAGISIDINASPYTDFANIPTWGQYAYGPSGCAWFASARVKQLTGQGNMIYSGQSWYNSAYATYGFSRGNTLQAPALACYQNHVVVVEKIEGDTVYISEGGMSGYGANASTGYTVIRAVNKSNMGHAGAESQNTLIGYVYLGNSNSGNSSPTTSISYGTISTEFVDTWNAGLYGEISNPSRLTVSSVGTYIWDSQGNLVVNHSENCGLSTSVVYQRLNVVSEALSTGLRSGETYTYQLFAQANGQTCYSEKATFTVVDDQKPVISDIKIYDIDSEGYTVSCVVTDNYEVDRVQFPTWTVINDRDDIATDWGSNVACRGNKDGNTYTFRVKRSEHNNEYGYYRTHIYAYDKAGNSAAANAGDLEIKEVVQTTTPEITETPEVTNTPEITESPDVTVTPGITESPEETATLEITESPKVTGTPEVTSTPKVTENPEVTVTPELTEQPEATSTPKITEKPEETSTPEVTEQPEVTNTPQATKQPEETGTSVPTNTPGTTATAGTTISTGTNTSTGNIQETTVPDTVTNSAIISKVGTSIYTYELNSDGKTITIQTCTSSAVTIKIPSTIDGYTVTGIGERAFLKNKTMVELEFPATLTTIGDYAFEGCTRLTCAVLPDSLTSLGDYVFKDCTYLVTAVVNEGQKDITTGLFKGCSVLNTVVLPDSIMYIRAEAFQGCSKLTTLELPKSLLTISENAFLDSGIKSIIYKGTSADWKKVHIVETGNSSLLKITPIYALKETISKSTVTKPSKVKLKSVKAQGKKKLKVSWKWKSSVAGYQVQYSFNYSFTKGKKTKNAGAYKNAITLKKLKSKKTYYVRVRAYKKSDGKKIYGSWSSVKSCKVK